MFRRILNAVKKKPPAVITFRLRQELVLHWLERTGYWLRYSRRIGRALESAQVADVAHGSVLVSAEGLAKLAANSSFSGAHYQLQEFADRICAGSYSVFGWAIPPLADSDVWWRDWRFDKVWQPAYFKSYHFYESAKQAPYDVKFPWELSRLHFLQPVMLAACVASAGRQRRLDFVCETLRQWRGANPLAQTVVWYPMEASMRVPTLLFVLDLAAVLPRHPTVDEIRTIVRCMLAEHGEYIWRTREYTDLRGNHYAANISALLLAGAALRQLLPAARTWYRFAADQLGGEVLAQFSEDGVNIEKSIPYHRLVTELFFVATLAVERQRDALPDAVRERLRKACGFLHAVRTDDGSSPNWGDNDDGRVLVFEELDPRNHAPLLQAAASAFVDRSLGVADEAGRLTALVLTGTEPAGVGQAKRADWFRQGGFAALRAGGQYLLVDIGEIGLHGRGGHGHLDILSFEYHIDGSPVVVDPGCPTYTGDMAKRNAFRSGYAHNGLLINGQDIGRLVGAWGVAEAPCPRDVAVGDDGETLWIRGSHSGFERQAVPTVRHVRRYDLTARGIGLNCSDDLAVTQECLVERRLFLSPRLPAPRVGNGFLDLALPGRTVRLQWNIGCVIDVRDCTISPGYGRESPSRMIVLRDRVKGSTRLTFAFSQVEADS